MELGLVELPTRPRSEYTAAIRRCAIESSDQGQLREAADLTRAAMTESGYARGVLGSLVDGLWGLPMNFIGDPEMIRALVDTPRGLGEWRTMFPQPEARKLLSWGINLGVGVGQMRRRWHEPGEQIVDLDELADGTYRARLPPRPVGEHATRVLRAWDPKWLRYEWDTESWWLMTAAGEIRITPNDGEWILYLPYGSEKPWEFGAWRPLTLAWVLARDAIFDRSRHAEVLAPVRVGKVPQGTTERQRKKFLDQIKAMQRMQAFVLPPGLEYDIVESTGKVADIYEKIASWAEREYCLIYTGNETTTKGSPGFSAGDVQERIAKAVLQSFSGSLSSCLRDGGLVHWSVDNYGTTDAPLAQFDCEPPEDKLAKAKTVGEAGDALGKMAEGLEKVGLRVTMESAIAYAQSFGFAVEAIPASEAKAAKIELAPSDKAKVFRAREVRAGEGYPPFGDERDDMTLPELDARAASASGGGAPPGAPALPVGPAPTVAPVVAADEGAPPTDEAARALAAKMTEHGVSRCEHGSSNRCRLCGIERVRDFDPGAGPGGEHVWRVAWRSIGEAVGVQGPDAATLAAGFNPDQERDADGKFGEGGGSSSGGGDDDDKDESESDDKESDDAKDEDSGSGDDESDDKEDTSGDESRSKDQIHHVGVVAQRLKDAEREAKSLQKKADSTKSKAGPAAKAAEEAAEQAKEAQDNAEQADDDRSQKESELVQAEDELRSGVTFDENNNEVALDAAGKAALKEKVSTLTKEHGALVKAAKVAEKNADKLQRVAERKQTTASNLEGSIEEDQDVADKAKEDVALHAETLKALKLPPKEYQAKVDGLKDHYENSFNQANDDAESAKALSDKLNEGVNDDFNAESEAYRTGGSEALKKVEEESAPRWAARNEATKALFEANDRRDSARKSVEHWRQASAEAEEIVGDGS